MLRVDKPIIAVDIGATNIRVALTDGSRLIDKVVESTVKLRSSCDLALQVVRLSKSIMDRYRIDSIAAVGIATIGPMDMRSGELFNVANLPMETRIDRIPLRKPVEDTLDVPVFMINDASAAALAEHMFGAGIGLANLVYITLSTGIGGGVIVDNNLLKGKDGNAHEIGHIVVDMEEKLVCGCGGRGHWEAYCSGSGIPKYTKLIAESREELWYSSLLYRETGGYLDKVTSKLVYDLARRGDEFSMKIVEDLGRINAMGFASVINVYDPELITVGGSIALYNSDLILPYIERWVGRYTVNRIPRIIVTPLGADIGLYGGMAVAVKGLKGEI
jgi:glucokinase